MNTESRGTMVESVTVQAEVSVAVASDQDIPLQDITLFPSSQFFIFWRITGAFCSQV